MNQIIFYDSVGILSSGATLSQTKSRRNKEIPTIVVKIPSFIPLLVVQFDIKPKTTPLFLLRLKNNEKYWSFSGTFLILCVFLVIFLAKCKLLI